MEAWQRFATVRDSLDDAHDCKLAKYQTTVLEQSYEHGGRFSC